MKGVRVYLPTTWAALPALATAGVPPATTGYAATAALAEALDVPVRQDELLEDAPDTSEHLDDLHAAAAAAAADHSLLLLADGPEPGPARRAVVVAVAHVSTVPGHGEHPGAVRLEEAVPWSRVEAVLADGPGDEPAVAAALAALGADADAGLERAVAVLDDVALGWFAPSEVAAP
ncbi:DUF6912 family protein [Aquipuribacter nitratireducens]|uniref:DUF6912 family protein n=1 Tax=Aquipuribacter nitratireducens TaxID=650104 RepID=UPI0030EC8F56